MSGSGSEDPTRRLKERHRQQRVLWERDNRKLAKALEDALAELDQIKEQAKDQPGTAELTAEVERLHGLIREGAHFTAFEDAAIKAGVNPAMIEDLWKLAPTEIGDDDPDPKAIATHVTKALAARPAFKATSADEDDDEESSSSSKEPPTAVDLAKPKPKSAKTATTEEEDGDEPPEPEPAPRKGTPTPSTNGKATLGRGEGNARGVRGKPNQAMTATEKIDADFAQTGRSNPFAI